MELDSLVVVIMSMKMLITLEEFANFKYHDDIPLECTECHATFHRKKALVRKAMMGTSGHKFEYCSPQCIAIRDRRIAPSASTEVQCNQCSAIFEKKNSEIKKCPRHFCNHSCAALYNHSHKVFKKNRRSQAEHYLVALIRSSFPDLEINENDRSLLKNGFEIDILLPTLRLAIEINGPVHFFPIYGDKKFERIQDIDIQKQIEIQSLGYNLLVIDVSQCKGKKSSEQLLDSVFATHILPLLAQA